MIIESFPFKFTNFLLMKHQNLDRAKFLCFVTFILETSSHKKSPKSVIQSFSEIYFQ